MEQQYLVNNGFDGDSCCTVQENVFLEVDLDVDEGHDQPRRHDASVLFPDGENGDDDQFCVNMA